MALFVFSLFLIVHLSFAYYANRDTCDSRIEHTFTVIDYDWPNDTAREMAIRNESYIPNNNIISGMNVYNDAVYVTVPRWRRGVPSTLNKIVIKDGISILQPYPNWESQRVGDCHALQFVQSIAIDPNTGWMWIIDTGRINFFAIDGTPTENLCPAKIIIYDIDNNIEITRHEFPDNVANRKRTFLNDIVIQYRGQRARYAYITDDFDTRLIVFDRKKNTSHFYSHPESMLPESGNGNITILGETLAVSDGINGIALSSDMKFIYYGQLSGFSIYQIPTKVVRKPGKDFDRFVRKVGTKPAHAAGMVYSKNHSLYFGGLDDNAVYKWDVEKDRRKQRTTFRKVQMKTVQTFLKDDSCINFVDILNFDQNDNLWFSVNKLHKFFLGTMDFSGNSGPNVLIMRAKAGTTGYLDRRRRYKPY
ncbi:protein yellow-like [Mizuhopecten yessoensis]|uniref:Protein yellow n=1 Tax=Mizuhopecten yessoensis TaxID=6573 RepID=A0A210Q9N2_MIZYE|nr:protein yellow-like [Mizuhopecten yessoensis]OWF45425.1 Protein yellow [Mizuhopecten yessoensis]